VFEGPQAAYGAAKWSTLLLLWRIVPATLLLQTRVGNDTTGRLTPQTSRLRDPILADTQVCSRVSDP